jgi:RNA polymerase sigma-70 factor (ECF subfamily)
MSEGNAVVASGRPKRREELPFARRNYTAERDERLTQTFNDLRDELIGTLRLILGNRDDAQDLVQETFLRCWRAREELADVENLRGWIFRVGINAARDLQRSAWRRRARPLLREEDVPRCDGSPARALEDHETLQHLRQALLRLRPEEKQVFLLRQNGGWTYAQIAALCRRPIGTVKTQMRSALQKLRRVLSPRQARE